tara:strand:+ start:735 stop:2300 length:1566 start_codon:yes stop_codon:yes gene_type:complete
LVKACVTDSCSLVNKYGEVSKICYKNNKLNHFKYKEAKARESLIEKYNCNINSLYTSWYPIIQSNKSFFSLIFNEEYPYLIMPINLSNKDVEIKDSFIVKKQSPIDSIEITGDDLCSFYSYSIYDKTLNKLLGTFCKDDIVIKSGKYHINIVINKKEEVVTPTNVVIKRSNGCGGYRRPFGRGKTSTGGAGRSCHKKTNVKNKIEKANQPINDNILYINEEQFYVVFRVYYNIQSKYDNLYIGKYKYPLVKFTNKNIHFATKLVDNVNVTCKFISNLNYYLNSKLNKQCLSISEHEMIFDNFKNALIESYKLLTYSQHQDHWKDPIYKKDKICECLPKFFNGKQLCTSSLFIDTFTNYAISSIPCNNVVIFGRFLDCKDKKKSTNNFSFQFNLNINNYFNNFNIVNSPLGIYLGSITENELDVIKFNDTKYYAFVINPKYYTKFQTITILDNVNVSVLYKELNLNNGLKLANNNAEIFHLDGYESLNTMGDNAPVIHYEESLCDDNIYNLINNHYNYYNNV